MSTVARSRVGLRELTNLEQVTDFPHLHLRALARIAATDRWYGVHVAAGLGDVARHLTPPEVMQLTPIATLWRQVAAKIDGMAGFYRGHPEFGGWCEDASAAIRAALNPTDDGV